MAQTVPQSWQKLVLQKDSVVIFYFMPVNNWRSHTKYRTADLIQRVTLLAAKIYTCNMCQLLERKEPLMIKTSLCRIQSSCWQIVVTVISAAYRKKERAVNMISHIEIMHNTSLRFRSKDDVSAIKNKIRIAGVKISFRKSRAVKALKSLLSVRYFEIHIASLSRTYSPAWKKNANRTAYRCTYT